MKISKGQRLQYSVSGTFVATVIIQKSINNGGSWETIASVTTDTSAIITADESGLYRFLSQDFTSGTAVCDMISLPQVLDEIKNKDGDILMRVTEDGIEFPSGVSFGSGRVAYTYREPEDVIVFEGDSLTANSSLEGKVDNIQDSTLHNVATGGHTLSQIIADAPEQVDAKYEDGKTNRLFVWIGVNDLLDAGSTTAAEAHALLRSYCEARANIGWKVSVLTLPEADGLADATKVTDYNTLIRENVADYADELVDIARDVRFQTSTDTDYFNADELHLTTTGYELAGDIINSFYSPQYQKGIPGEMAANLIRSSAAANTYIEFSNGWMDFRGNSGASLLMRVGNGSVAVNAGGHATGADFIVYSDDVSEVIRVDADGDSGGGLLLLDVPTSDPSVAGAIYSNSGVLTVSAG